MKTYSISYDLGNPGRDYADLISKIKEIGNGWCHAAESTWFINSSQSCSEIRETLGSLMDSNDKLIVFSVGDNWATKGMSTQINDWLKNNWRSACTNA